jgi:hypothetical protein
LAKSKLIVAESQLWPSRAKKTGGKNLLKKGVEKSATDLTQGSKHFVGDVVRRFCNKNSDEWCL